MKCKTCSGTGVLTEEEFKQFVDNLVARHPEYAEKITVVDNKECPICLGKGKLGFRRILNLKSAAVKK